MPPRQTNNERRCRRLFHANPITTGLLLYVAFFQMIFYRSYRAETSTINERRHSAWLRLPPTKSLRPIEWKPFSSEKIKLPYPIFVTSLPKSGTTSVWRFFQCGKQLAAHNWIQKRGKAKSSLLGVCIEENIIAGHPPFENCGDNDVFTDTGVRGCDVATRLLEYKLWNFCSSQLFFTLIAVPQLFARYW